MGHNGGSGPPDKFNAKAKTDSLSSEEVLTLLNSEADKGNNTFVSVPCADGNFLFFGNYKK